ncbi:MAG: phosphodiester glycosidase family protein [Clostridia bacterium]|nr:phosphodiester glycosidase family protein [Clostridia bacterium]
MASRNSERKSRTRLDEEQLLRDHRTLVEMEKREKKRVRRAWHWGTFRHVLLVLLTLILAIVTIVVMVVGQFLRGPSPTASDLVVQTLMESSALKFVPYLFLFEKTDEAIQRNTLVVPEEATDASLVTVRAHSFADETGDSETGEVFDENGVRIEEVVGPTYRGYMMIVRDPAQVMVGVSHNPFSKAHAGKKVNEIIDSYDAVGGINAGAFYDANGTGNGGEPLGLVYSEGKRLNRADNGAYKTVVGFDKDNILRVGTYTSDEAEKIGLRDAVAFGPALIVNGKAATIKGNSSGLNPRSAIGQRSDGAVLLLAIDGRQANSFGASYADLIKVMQDYGAVNACNLDGGSSTVMYYEGEQKNDGMAISASRRLPTAWIVKRGEN